MGIHEIPKRDRSVWWLWVGIFALVALLIYVALHAFSTSTGAPVARADQGVQADAKGWQKPTQAAPKASQKNAPVPAPTVTLQGYQKTIPGPKVTVTAPAIKVPVPVPGPTVKITTPAPAITKTIKPKPRPTKTITITVTITPAPTPEPTQTITPTPEPTEIATPDATASKIIKPDPPLPSASPSGGE